MIECRAIMKDKNDNQSKLYNISKNVKKQKNVNDIKKESAVKKRKVLKTVQGHSIKLTDEELNQISKVFEAYGSCADLFYERFSSVRYMTDVKSWIE